MAELRSPETHYIFDELFIGVRSGPALYCFDVTNDDGCYTNGGMASLLYTYLREKKAISAAGESIVVNTWLRFCNQGELINQRQPVTL